MTAGSAATPRSASNRIAHSSASWRPVARASSLPAASRLRSQPKPCSSRAQAALGGSMTKGERPRKKAMLPARPNCPCSISCQKLGSAVRRSGRHDQQVIDGRLGLGPAFERRGERADDGRSLAGIDRQRRLAQSFLERHFRHGSTSTVAARAGVGDEPCAIGSELPPAASQDKAGRALACVQTKLSGESVAADEAGSVKAVHSGQLRSFIGQMVRQRAQVALRRSAIRQRFHSRLRQSASA